jgi:hypothetical protein
MSDEVRVKRKYNYTKKTGHPTKYKPEYCQMLIDHMAAGFSYETFAAVVKVCDDTLREWEKKNKEFSASKTVAFIRNKYFWEQAGIDGMKGKITNFNATSFVFNMKNRFGWRDKKDIDTTHRFDNVSDEKLKELAKKALEFIQSEGGENAGKKSE